MAGAAAAALEVHDAKSVFESNWDVLAIEREQIVLRITFVVPVAVAIAPFKLVVVRLAGHTDVVIKCSDVEDVGREANQLPVAVAIQAAFVDVAVCLTHLHHLG